MHGSECAGGLPCPMGDAWKDARTRTNAVSYTHLVRNEGGDRSATVRALPLVIEGLRQKGLEIVPLSELLEEEFGEEFPVVEIPE